MDAHDDFKYWETDKELNLPYEWDGSRRPIETRTRWLWGGPSSREDSHSPPLDSCGWGSYPSSSYRKQRGPRILFPAREWALPDAGVEYNVWLMGVGGNVPVAVEVAFTSSAAWVAVASVIRTYLTRHKDRKVVMYNDGKPVLEVSGDISVKDIETLLRTQLPS